MLKRESTTQLTVLNFAYHLPELQNQLATIKIEDSTVYPASTVALIFPREVAYLGKIETTLLERYQQF